MAYVSLLGDQAGLGREFFATANSARVYEHLLGGCESYEPDRAAARAVYQSANWIRTAALINRDYGLLSVKWSLGRGVRQFLDLGCGYPGTVNVHDVTAKAQRSCHVVYVDNDQGVLAHAKFRLDESDDNTVIGADLLAMDRLLTCEAMRSAFDLNAPVAVLLHDVLPWCTDDTALHPAMTMLLEWMPVGSTLSITHLTDHWHRSTMPDVQAAFTDHDLRIRPRSHDEISNLFGDFVQQGRGLTATGQWHERGGYVRHPQEHSAAFAGIAVKQALPQKPSMAGSGFPHFQSEESP